MKMDRTCLSGWTKMEKTRTATKVQHESEPSANQSPPGPAAGVLQVNAAAAW